MQDSKISEWLQIIASLGVLAGLLLVAYEIRESNRVAISEGSRAVSEIFSELSRSEYETDIYDLLAKSIENPGELSLADTMKLNSYFSTIIQTFGLWEGAYELGTARQDALENLKQNTNFYFGSKFGRAWFDVNRSWIRPEIADVIATELNATPGWGVPLSAERIKSGL
jgi:hypothetical protein